MLDDARAFDLLHDLVKTPGELRIITNLPDPQAETSDPRDPAYNMLMNVVAIEASGDVLVARSAEGALCIGKPLDLLLRLLEWDYFDPQDPGGTRERALADLERLA